MKIPTMKLMGWLLLAGSVLLVAVVWLERHEEKQLRQEQAPRPNRPVSISITAVESGELTRWVVGEGRVQAVRKRVLQFEESGMVAKVAKAPDGGCIREGTMVSGPGAKHPKGQMLAKLDDRDTQAEIRQSEAAQAEALNELTSQQAALSQSKNDLREAQRHARRNSRLFSKRVVPQSDLDKAEVAYKNAHEAVKRAEAAVAAASSRVESAKAVLEKAKRVQDKITLYAPFDGLLARINIREGDFFDLDDVDHSSESNLLETAAMTVIDPTEMEVTLYLPEYEGRGVTTGQRVLVVPGAVDGARAGADKEELFAEGTVHAVSPQVDAARRAILVKVRFRQRENRILDGMFVSCWIAVETKKNALKVPLACLLFENDQAFVFTVANSQAVKRKIELGIIDEAYAEVLVGLREGETVACKGRKQLHSGQPVRKVEAGEVSDD